MCLRDAVCVNVYCIHRVRIWTSGGLSWIRRDLHSSAFLKDSEILDSLSLGWIFKNFITQWSYVWNILSSTNNLLRAEFFYMSACIVSLYVTNCTSSSRDQACCTVITLPTPEEVIKTRISPSSLTLSHYDTQR